MVDEMNTKNYTEDKFDKIFLDAKDKNVAKVVIYVNEHIAFYKRDSTEKVTADDLIEAFNKGCVMESKIKSSNLVRFVPFQLYELNGKLKMLYTTATFNLENSSADPTLTVGYVEVDI